MIAGQSINFAAKPTFGRRIHDPPKLKLVLCECAGLVAQNVADSAELFSESEVLHSCLLQLFQICGLVIVHHLHI